MKRIGVLIGVAAFVLLPWRAWAQCTVPAATSFEFPDEVVPIPDSPACDNVTFGAPIARTINVTSANTFIADVNVRLNVTHSCPGNLQATLTSPQGTIVSLFTNPSGSRTACFATTALLDGTTFDDAADPAGSVPYDVNNGLATDISPDFSSTATFLAPEEALAAFQGEDPEGIWTLRLADICGAGGTGQLEDWGLDIVTLPSPPVSAANTFPGPGSTLEDPGVTISSIDVDGLPPFLTDVDVFTTIEHTFNAQLQIALRSPSGRIATLSSGNGLDLDNVFNGTLWDDQVDPDGQVPYAASVGNSGLVADGAYSNNANLLVVVPEEGLGSFYGEDPNGTWTLIISDQVPGEGGALSNWNLVITTGTCATPTPTPTGTLTPTATVTPGGPTPTPPGPTNTPGPSPTPTPVVAPKICNGLPSTIVGTSGNDLIIGTDGDDVIHSKGGNDEVKGRGGADILCGGGGNDVVRGGGDADFLKGGSGNDFLKGGGDRDVILGNKGDDVINGGKDADTCIDDNGSNSFANCEDVND